MEQQFKIEGEGVLNKLYQILQKKVFRNILWLSFDKGIRLFLSFFVGLWMARYLGPLEWGKLNYLQAYVVIMSVVSTLGTDSFLVKEILERPSSKFLIMGTAFYMRIMAVITMVLFLGIFFYFSGEKTENYLLIAFLLIPVLFSPFDIIDIEYQSLLQSKKTVLARNSANIIGAFIKIELLLTKRPLIYFAMALGLEALLASLFLIIQYQIQTTNLFKWKFSRILVPDLLKRAWPFVLSALSIILYMRIDQIMLGKMVSDKEVGQFSAAVKITELFAFIPMVVSSSYLPILIESKKNKGRKDYFQKIYMYFEIMSLISICIAILITIFSGFVTNLFYGSKYPETRGILIIHIWAIIPIFLGVAGSQYLVIENLQKFTFYQTLSGLIINILINIALIPKFGAYGAATATLISYYFVAIFSHLIFKKTNIVFKIQMQSVKDACRFKSIKTLLK